MTGWTPAAAPTVALPGIMPGEGLEGGAIGLALEAPPEIGDGIEPVVDGELHAGARAAAGTGRAIVDVI